MRSALLLLLSAIATNHASAACAPEKLARIVFRDATPGIERESFAGQPKTLYRLGDRYVRIEEAFDSHNGIHGLSIVAEPDSWMINLATKTGQHILDRTQPFVVHAPVFGGLEGAEIFKTFEFGCELAYMRERKVKPERTVVGRFTLDNYRFIDGADAVILSIIAGSERPLYAGYSKNGKVVAMYQYIQYDLGLEPDLSLFSPPKGITLVEAGPPN